MGTVERYKTPGGKEGYLARFSYVDGRGRRHHRKRRFRLKKEAEAWVAQGEADLSRSVFFEPSRELFGDVLDRWVAKLGPPRAPGTVRAYKVQAARRFAAIRDVPLADLTPGVMKELLASWQAAKLGPQTINQALLVLNRVLEYAIDHRLLRENPSIDVKRLPVEQKPIVVWSPEQVQAFLDGQRDQPLYLAWVSLFATMGRIGEVAALRWEDIDLDEALVSMRQHWILDEANQLRIEPGTKNSETGRQVPIPPDVVALLAHHRPAAATGPLFVDGHGKALAPDRIRAAWKRAVTASGLPQMTPHGARHTGATNLIATTDSPVVVQRVLGHKSLGFTLRVYVHPQENEIRHAVETLSGLYRGDLSMASAQSAPKVIPMRQKAPEDAKESS